MSTGNGVAKNPRINAVAGFKLEALKTLAESLLDEVQDLEVKSNADIAGGISLYAELRRYETDLIRRALAFAGGSQRRAARLLGLKPSTLNSKIKRYRILP